MAFFYVVQGLEDLSNKLSKKLSLLNLLKSAVFAMLLDSNVFLYSSFILYLVL